VEFLSKRDRARLAEIVEKREKCRDLAAKATNDRQRRHYERLVKDFDLQIRTQRTFPFSIWLAGAAVTVALLPWALLTRHGHSGLGLAASGAVVVVEVLAWMRSRRRRKPSQASTS